MPQTWRVLQEINPVLSISKVAFLPTLWCDRTLYKLFQHKLCHVRADLLRSFKRFEPLFLRIVFPQYFAAKPHPDKPTWFSCIKWPGTRKTRAGQSAFRSAYSGVVPFCAWINRTKRFLHFVVSPATKRANMCLLKIIIWRRICSKLSFSAFFQLVLIPAWSRIFFAEHSHKSRANLSLRPEVMEKSMLASALLLQTLFFCD